MPDEATLPTEATRGLVDTNVVILRDRIAADALPDEIAISVVTLGELSVGPHAVVGDGPEAHAERARRTGILQRAEAEFDPLPFDADAARVYGELAGALLAHGRTPRRRHADLQIAATAVVHAVPLYTTNPDDFAGLEEYLTVVAVPRPASDENGA